MRKPEYPTTPRHPVVDEVHGETITDPYRWLEDDKDPAVIDWAEERTALTRNMLDALPARQKLATRLHELMETGNLGSPKVIGGDLFYTRRAPGKNQPYLCFRPTDGGEQVIVDPNALNEEGTTALDWWYPSPDGQLVAYGLSQDGDEWSTLRVIDKTTGEHLSEEIPRTRYSSVAWLKDCSAFYYTRYAQKGDVPEGEENYHSRVRYHKLGTDPSNDPVIFGEGRPMKEMRQLSIANDGRHLLVTAMEGWNRSELFVRDLTGEGTDLQPIVTEKDANFWGRIVDGSLYVLTNWKAPKYRVLRIDMASPEEVHWVEVIPEAKDLTLQGLTIAGGRLLLHGLRDVVSKLYVHELDGSLVNEVSLPTMGSILEMTGEAGHGTAYFTYTSFTLPTAIMALDIDIDTIQCKAAVEVKSRADSDIISVSQAFYRSKDGTRVPIFILHRKDLQPNGDTPTLLTGYGGFNISRTPGFSPTIFPWLENGGIWALANLRGGSEYGEEWHRGGMRGKKQNVYDDFTAAAEYLIEEGYTDPEHLGISGRSNGGLLVGAALTQRPDLYGAVVCGVPLLDMLRYHLFLIGALWDSEYGSPDDPEAFKWLRAYSPYHNVREGEKYPATLLFTAMSDTRVHPCHAFKMAALLQQVNASDEPILLRVETAAGHGAGKPVSKIVNEQADIWAFLSWQLGLDMV